MTNELILKKFEQPDQVTNFDKGTYLVKVSNSELSKTERIVIE